MMRPRRARRPGRTALWTVTYVACFVLVLSFILFEVLDVDGSDFGTLARTATIKLAEPPQDLRRAPLPAPLGAPPSLVVASACAGTLLVPLRIAAARAAPPAHPTLRRDSRSTLARALLPDPASSA